MRGELQRTQQELLESDRLATIGRMASSVSHDLRHHLSAIYANAEFMSLEHAGLEDRRDLLLEIKDGVQGMTDLIESLLFFSHNGHVLHLQHESLAQLLERTVHNVRQHPECRKVQILVEQLDPAEASVDTVKLSRALYNLLLNACQAAAAGAVAPVVTVVLSEEDEKICIAISDTGSGVPPSIRDTLFQPFVSLGKVNGTGLGLTVAQHIVQEHGGEITLKESTLGKTVFSILLYKKALHALDRLNATNAAYAAPKRAERFNEEELAFSQELP
jgi:signal transduction histidine kinase